MPRQTERSRNARANEQKFFGSFFQKRTKKTITSF
jgi:hypothetical protein